VPAYVTVPGTFVEPCFNVNVELLIVDGSIDSLKVKLMSELRETPVTLLTGSVAITVGFLPGLSLFLQLIIDTINNTGIILKRFIG
jgi:hypothetical protein